VEPPVDGQGRGVENIFTPQTARAVTWLKAFACLNRVLKGLEQATTSKPSETGQVFEKKSLAVTTIT
jgi:hypothetical protein